MCGGGVPSILLLPLLARCLEAIDICIWRRFVVVIVWVSVRMLFVSAAVVKYSGFLKPWSVEVCCMFV